jgi:YesN/AraC family two-component response regulator
MMLRIRNMESDRCKAIVREELNKLGIHLKSIELGEVELKESITGIELEMIDAALKKSGLELMSNSKTILIGKIKEAVNRLVYYSEDLSRPNFSDYISKQVNYDYNYLSKIFSEIEGITIEKYIIKQRVERVKEMLVYERLSLNEIAYKMLYSSVSHLSNQFKKVTGLSPVQFRQLKNKNPVTESKISEPWS